MHSSIRQFDSISIRSHSHVVSFSDDRQSNYVSWLCQANHEITSPIGTEHDVGEKIITRIDINLHWFRSHRTERRGKNAIADDRLDRQDEGHGEIPLHFMQRNKKTQFTNFVRAEIILIEFQIRQSMKCIRTQKYSNGWCAAVLWKMMVVPLRIRMWQKIIWYAWTVSICMSMSFLCRLRIPPAAAKKD